MANTILVVMNYVPNVLLVTNVLKSTWSPSNVSQVPMRFPAK